MNLLAAYLTTFRLHSVQWYDQFIINWKKVKEMVVAYVEIYQGTYMKGKTTHELRKSEYLSRTRNITTTELIATFRTASH